MACAMSSLIRLQRAQLRVDFRVVIEPSGELADKAAVPMSHQCEIDRTAGSEIREAIRRKDPASLAGLTPPEDLAVSAVDVFAHSACSYFLKEIYICISFKSKAMFRSMVRGIHIFFEKLQNILEPESN